MKYLIEWLKKNTSTLFTFLGIVLTIYFSIFYIPAYVKEMREEKVNNINNTLIENVQELVYNKHRLSLDEIQSMIKGKELRYNITYPYSAKELLILTQERFLDNKFIPLSERTILISSIDSIKNQIASIDTSRISIAKISNSSSDIISIIVSLIGVILGIVGAFSAFIKLKKEKELDLEKNINDRSEEIENRIKNAFEYELMVEDILKTLGLDYSRIPHSIRDYNYDFLISLNKQNYVVEIKYSSSKSKMSAHTISKLAYASSENNAKGILITNVELTYSASEALIAHNTNYKESTIFVARSESKEELINTFKKILKLV